VKVFQPAVLRTAPVGPNRKRNYAVVLFLAVLGSLGLALALEYLNQSLKTPEDVEKHLGLPVLATLSYKEFKSCI
jgi:capsular polysaccharide biosynthesis protein